MTYFIISIVFITLLFLAFWLPFRKGNKILSFVVSGILSPLVIISLVTEFGYLTTISLLVLFTFLIIFVSYWTLINLNFKKAAKFTLIIFTAIATLPILWFALEDYFFFKSDAKKMLMDNQIELKDNFKINYNRISGLSDLYQIFELEISPADKDRVINQIKQSPYFNDTLNPSYSLLSDVKDGIAKKIYLDREINNVVTRESYQKPKMGYTFDYDIISITKERNTLTFERFND